MVNGAPEGSGGRPTRHSEGVESSGRSVNEAVQDALSTLRLQREDVEVEVIDEGSRGVLGLGAREARVRVRPRSDQRPSVILSIVEELAGLMGFPAAVTAVEGPENVRVDVQGENLGALIGKHGQTLAALEALTGLMVGRRLGTPVRIELDVMGYRSRRRAVLEGLAQRTAGRVARTGREVALPPMDARERRIIHVTLQEHPSVTTASRGEEDLRRVIVMPRGPTEGEREPQETPPQGGRASDRRPRQKSGEGGNQRSRGAGTASGRPERGANQKYSGRWSQGSRAGRFLERSFPAARSPGRSPSRKPVGPGAPGSGPGRPDGLPVDEELEAEIQAHLEKANRGGAPDQTDPPKSAETEAQSARGQEPEEE